VIESWPNSPSYGVLGGEPAIPNLLLSGIATVWKYLFVLSLASWFSLWPGLVVLSSLKSRDLTVVVFSLLGLSLFESPGEELPELVGRKEFSYTADDQSIDGPARRPEGDEERHHHDEIGQHERTHVEGHDHPN